MGYTHYWNVKRDADREKVAEAGREMARAVEAANVDLAGGHGTGEPSLGEDGSVWFNGRAPDDNHETFVWPPDLDDPQELLGPDRPTVFTFCKTAYKPYDPVVVACLLRAKAVLGDAISVSTDAADEDEFLGHRQSEGWSSMVGLPGIVSQDGPFPETADALYRRVFGEEPDLSGIIR